MGVSNYEPLMCLSVDSGSTWFLDELDDSDVDVLVLPPIDGVPWGRSEHSLLKRRDEGEREGNPMTSSSWVPRTFTMPSMMVRGRGFESTVEYRSWNLCVL